MTSKTTNRFSPEVRARAVRLVLDHEGEHTSWWAAVSSIAAKIGCTAQTLREWVKNRRGLDRQRWSGARFIDDRLPFNFCYSTAHTAR